MSSDNSTDPQNLWQLAGINAFAGLASGAGAIGGVFLGASDGFNHTLVPLAILGMVLLSGAVAWLVKRPARNHYIASLPFFWFLIGGILIVRHIVGSDSDIEMGIILILAITAGRTVSEVLLKYLNERDLKD